MLYFTMFIIGGIAGFVLCSILTMGTVSELRQTITILRMELDKYKRSDKYGRIQNDDIH